MDEKIYNTIRYEIRSYTTDKEGTEWYSLEGQLKSFALAEARANKLAGKFSTLAIVTIVTTEFIVKQWSDQLTPPEGRV